MQSCLLYASLQIILQFFGVIFSRRIFTVRAIFLRRIMDTACNAQRICLLIWRLQFMNNKDQENAIWWVHFKPKVELLSPPSFLLRHAPLKAGEIRLLRCIFSGHDILSNFLSSSYRKNETKVGIPENRSSGSQSPKIQHTLTKYKRRLWYT